MVGLLRVIRGASRYQWMVTLAVTFACIFCSLPEKGICGSTGEILNQPNVDSVKAEFDQLHNVLSTSANPLNEARNFFQSFVNEINAKYGMTLTVPEAYQLIRVNLHSLQISTEVQNAILATLELLESGSDRMLMETQNVDHGDECHSFHWPWEWKWFGLNKKKDTDKHQPRLMSSTQPGKELPANCYIGGVEMLAGALVFLLPIPGAQALSIGIIGDGARRVIDGVVQLGEERRNDSNFVPPKSPY